MTRNELKFAMGHEEAQKHLENKKNNPDYLISDIEFARLNAHIEKDKCDECFKKGKEIGLFGI